MHDFKICVAPLALFYLITPCSVLPRLSSAASRLAPLVTSRFAPRSFFKKRRATEKKPPYFGLKFYFSSKQISTKIKFYKIYHFNFISQKRFAVTQGASNFKIEILYVKLKGY
ncbi:hypothetical protein CAMGR0001_0304 [Campylobacter gracilis RM3268]|uniref:Uncharacterized protein n=1 Tax=Campylobacter gracilis RM3268 TaxID=553220 RepID=C8PKT1_9BACT|nr:hypothetical protein CAMGR0001_0304 [Campylobacter gracilis RM3268]